MFYADQVGLPVVKEVLESIGIEPAPMLVAAVEAGQSLADFWKAKQAAEATVTANAAAGRSYTPGKM
jgi:hypothetical protein